MLSVPNNTIYACKIQLMNALQSVFGEHYVMQRYRARAIRRYSKAGIVFVHIPKSAGTSICDALFGGRVGHFTYEELSTPDVAPRIAHLPTFTLVRDPVKRLYSAWQYAKNGGGTKGSIKPNPAYQSACFQSFSTFLHEWLATQELANLDRIFWPQAWFVSDSNGQQVDYVGRLEDVVGAENWVRANFEQEFSIPHLNQQRSKSGTQDELTADDLNTIQSVYEIDYRMFGYA